MKLKFLAFRSPVRSSAIVRTAGRLSQPCGAREVRGDL